MSRLRLNKVAKPSAPAADKAEVYLSTVDERLKMIDDSGAEINLISQADKNILINGGFDFCQRAAVALTNITSPSATNRVYSADRWGFTVGNVATPQFQQVDTVGAIEAGITARYYARYKQLTNAAKIALVQVIEAASTQPLRGRVVRFQIKARYSVGSNRTMRLGMVCNTGTVDAPTAGWISAFNANTTDPTLGASLAYIAPTLVENGTIVGNAMSFILTSAWQRFSATFTVPSDCDNIMPVIFSDSTFAANDDFLITECACFEGQEILDWNPASAADEILRVQRFYCKTFPIGVVPVTNSNNGVIKWGVGVAGANAGTWGGWRFPVRMVKAPTVTLFNPAAANAQVRQFSATAGDCSVSSAANITDVSCEFTATPGATAVIGSVVGVNATADAEL